MKDVVRRIFLGVKMVSIVLFESDGFRPGLWAILIIGGIVLASFGDSDKTVASIGVVMILGSLFVLPGVELILEFVEGIKEIRREVRRQIAQKLGEK